MRRFGRFFFPLCGVSLLVSTLAYPQQPWSNLLSPSRAIDWKNAGLPASLPDGEVTPNPWTPPTRPACTSAQAGITVPVASGTSFSSIATALYNCSKSNPAGSYLLLGSGTFTLSNYFYFAGSASGPINNVTLRGSGPQSTIINFASNNINFQWGWSNGGNGGGTVASSPAQAATSVTITSTTGTPVVGNLAWIQQCDTGWSGSVVPAQGYNNCTTGSYADNGGLFVCGQSNVCDYSSSTPGSGLASQQQTVLITSVTNNGGGSYTVGFSPGLYLPNWKASNTIGFYWSAKTNFSFGDGIEDMTFNIQHGNNQAILLNQAYASWIKGVAIVGQPLYQAVRLGSDTKNSLIANSYVFGMSPLADARNSEMLVIVGDSDDLVINNIFDQGVEEIDGQSEGDVFAYNYNRDVSTAYYQAAEFQHDATSAGIYFFLDEGNVGGFNEYDDTWGTHLLSTTFRNWWSCGDAPYVIPGVTGSAIRVDNYARFMNLIGNALGGQSNACANYKAASSSENYEVSFGATDTLAQASAMLWGQYDAANGSQQFNSSEVPTTLTGNAAPFENSVPSSHALPASFFMDSMTAHSSGGTGLSWWKVCTNWATFPTSCSGTSIPPMPPVHPESTGGAYLSGHVDATPSWLAYQHLPIMSSYQNSYTVTGSNWSGNIETLTVSGLPTGVTNILGGFELSGANAACTTGATLPNGEILMTGSSSTTIEYALASNPGASCTGTVKWPDVRAFDERVYESDPSGTASPSPASGLGGSYQQIP